MIGIAMLSFWHVHGKDYAREAEAHPDTEIVAIWDEDPTRGRTEAEQRGVPFYEHLDDVLALPGVNGVVVDTPTVSHRDVILAAARAGKHIFTEKVIAPTLREAEEIIQAVEQAGVAFVVSMWRSDEASTQAIKAIVEEGILGTVTLARIRDGHPFALPSERFPNGLLPAQFYSRAEAAGGAVIDLCHPIYLACHYLGTPESVSAAFSSITGHEVEDNAAITLRYGSGTLGVVETGYVSPSTPFSVEIHGTQGSLLYSEPGIGERAARFRAGGDFAAPTTSNGGPDGRLRLRVDAPNGSGQWEVREIDAAARPKAFEQWVAHIRDGTRAPTNIALGLDLSAVVEAAYRSAATGTVVPLSTLERL